MRKKIIIILGIFLSCITTKVSAMTIGEENNNKITNTNITLNIFYFFYFIYIFII